MFKATDSFISSALLDFCLFLIYLVFFFLLSLFSSEEYGVRSSIRVIHQWKSGQVLSALLHLPTSTTTYYHYRTTKETKRDKLSWISPSRNYTKRKNHASFRIETAYTSIAILSLPTNTKSRHRYVCTFVTSRIPRPALQYSTATRKK